MRKCSTCAYLVRDLDYFDGDEICEHPKILEHNPNVAVRVILGEGCTLHEYGLSILFLLFMRCVVIAVVIASVILSCVGCSW